MKIIATPAVTLTALLSVNASAQPLSGPPEPWFAKTWRPGEIELQP